MNYFANCCTWKQTFCIVLAVVFTTLTGSTLRESAAQDLALDNGFNASVTDAPTNVFVSKVQEDGKILLGGEFKYVNGVAHNWFVRLNPDGTQDTSFNKGGAGPNGPIYDIVFISGNKMIVGGRFTSYNGMSIGGGIARLNADGSVDTTFNSQGVGTTGIVQTIDVRTDGKILISGEFRTFNGVDKFSVARLNDDGSLDNTFQAPFSTPQAIEEVDSLPDGKILIGGGFNLFVGEKVRRGIARLNEDGSLDTDFDVGGTGTDASVFAVTLQPDGRILVGGLFTAYNGVERNKIVRLNADGTLDVSFVPPPEVPSANGAADYFAIQPNGQILVAGAFNDVGTPVPGLIKLNDDGTQDKSFSCVTDGYGYHVTLQDDGKIIMVGSFSRVFPSESRLGVVRMDSSGTADPSFDASLSIDAAVTEMARQSDGKILVGGTFNRANQQIAHGLARFNADGTVDTSFSVGSGAFNNRALPITAIAVQQDGKILVGGTFTEFANSPHRDLTRLNSDGSIDDTFSAAGLRSGFLGIQDIVALPDGKILVTGDSMGITTGPNRLLLRLNSDGSLDPSFIQNGVGPVVSVRGYRLIIQPDGKIIVCGKYSAPMAPNSGNIVRLLPDGSRDTSFTPALGPNLPTLGDAILQSDGKIVTVSGPILSPVTPSAIRLNSDGTMDTGFAPHIYNGPIYSLAQQSSGEVLVGGVFNAVDGNPRSYIAKLNSNGSLDPGFVPTIETPNTSMYTGVNSMLSDPSGKIYVGGEFSSYNGVPRYSLLRLTPRKTLFDYDADGRSDVSVFRPATGDWYLQQSTNGFTGVNFGTGEDRIVPADFDGDGKTDVAVYRPSTGNWYVLNSSDGNVSYYNFGIAEDLPAPADYDGDGKADICVFRPSSGTWYRLNSGNGEFVVVQFGAQGDRPTVGDFDGDGKSDIAIFRPSEGAWYQAYSSDGTFFGEQFGVSTDRITPADYDGDGKTDIAIYRPAEGLWYVKNSATSTYSPYIFGIAEDIPVPGDYDGDGKADIAVWRPSDGTWYIVNSSNGSYTIYQFGQSGDKPTQSAFGN